MKNEKKREILTTEEGCSSAFEIFDGGREREAKASDEVNLSSLPLSVLAEDQRRTDLLIAHESFGSVAISNKKYGLPTVTDEIILLALAELTMERGIGDSPRLLFSKYHLLKKLAWHLNGKNYDRVNKCLTAITPPSSRSVAGSTQTETSNVSAE